MALGHLDAYSFFPMKFTWSRGLLRALLLLFVALHVSRAEPPPAAKPQTVRVLLIGNSLSGNAAFDLPAFARAGGKQLVLFSATPGGKSLQDHVSYLEAYERDPSDKAGHPYKKAKKPTDTEEPRAYSLIEALDSNTWDYVSIQQLSGLSYKPESFEPAAGRLIAVIHQHAPQAKILAYQTWPYRADHPLFHTGELTREMMRGGIKTAYDGLATKYQLRLVPVGEAFQAAEQSPAWQFTPDATYDFKNPPPDALPKESGTLQRGWARAVNGKLALDAKHANAYGCYLDAAVWYEVLFGEDVRPLTPKVVPELDEAKAADLRRIAHEVVTVHGAARIPNAPEAVKLLEAPHSPATNAPDTTLKGSTPPPAVAAPTVKDE